MKTQLPLVSRRWRDFKGRSNTELGPRNTRFTSRAGVVRCRSRCEQVFSFSGRSPTLGVVAVLKNDTAKQYHVQCCSPAWLDFAPHSFFARLSLARQSVERNRCIKRTHEAGATCSESGPWCGPHPVLNRRKRSFFMVQHEYHESHGAT